MLTSLKQLPKENNGQIQLFKSNANYLYIKTLLFSSTLLTLHCATFDFTDTNIILRYFLKMLYFVAVVFT